MTAKGGLIRSIQFPKPVDFKFYRDTYMFMIALALIALVGMIFTLVLMVRNLCDNICHGEAVAACVYHMEAMLVLSRRCFVWWRLIHYKRVF